MKEMKDKQRFSTYAYYTELPTYLPMIWSVAVLVIISRDKWGGVLFILLSIWKLWMIFGHVFNTYLIDIIALLSYLCASIFIFFQPMHFAHISIWRGLSLLTACAIISFAAFWTLCESRKIIDMFYIIYLAVDLVLAAVFCVLATYNISMLFVCVAFIKCFIGSICYKRAVRKRHGFYIIPLYPGVRYITSGTNIIKMNIENDYGRVLEEISCVKRRTSVRKQISELSASLTTGIYFAETHSAIIKNMSIGNDRIIDGKIIGKSLVFDEFRKTFDSLYGDLSQLTRRYSNSNNLGFGEESLCTAPECRKLSEKTCPAVNLPPKAVLWRFRIR